MEGKLFKVSGYIDYSVLVLKELPDALVVLTVGGLDVIFRGHHGWAMEIHDWRVNEDGTISWEWSTNGHLYKYEEG